MILVDTSVWVDHLRYGDKTLAHALTHGQVYIHPMIIGELVCGHLQNRQQLICLWKNLPVVTQASHHEAMFFVEANQLMGRGIGFVDVHLLASTRLTASTQLWTRDKRLAGIAQSLEMALSDR